MVDDSYTQAGRERGREFLTSRNKVVCRREEDSPNGKHRFWQFQFCSHFALDSRSGEG